MANYRNKRGEVGSYQNHPIIITTYAKLRSDYEAQIMDVNTYYIIADFDPVRKLTEDRMNVYKTCKDTYSTGQMGFLGYLYNDGRIDLKSPVVTNLFTPKQQGGGEEAIATAPQINFADYTRVVDEFMRSLA